MRTERCAECGTATPLAEMWQVAGATCCQPCAERVVKERGPCRGDQMAIPYALSSGRFFWADLFHGIAVGVLVPLALFRALV